MLDNYPRPMVFAHRGASANAPENTLAAFLKAIEVGADAVELDVKLSEDGIPVVIHDQTVDRTTNGTGKVNRLKYQVLKKFDAGSFFSTEFKDQKIPTLDEVFESIGGRVLVNVELTNYGSPQDELVDIVAECVERHKLRDGVLFSSFHPGNLIKVQRLIHGAMVGILALPGVPGIISRSFLHLRTAPQAIHPYLRDTSKTLVDREHKQGRRVHVWTVNKDEDLVRMIGLDVDGIFTDDPLKVLTLLGRK